MSQKKLMHLVGCEIKGTRPILKTKMLIYQFTDNKDEKNLFGKITHHLDPESREKLARAILWNKDSTFQSGPWFTCN